MPITIRKTNQLEHTPGRADQLKPKTPSVARRYAEALDDNGFSPIVTIQVSIAVVLRESTKFLECELMDKNITVPDTACMFYVRLEYRWQRKDGATDYDEILTDGQRFFLVNRELGASPFVLNDFTKEEITKSIAQYVESL